PDSSINCLAERTALPNFLRVAASCRKSCVNLLKNKAFVLAQTRCAAFVAAHGGAGKWISRTGGTIFAGALAITLVAHLYPDAASRLVRQDLDIPVVLNDSETPAGDGEFWREEHIVRGDTV